MKKRILVVDDDPSICELLRFRLARRNFEVCIAKNVREFWDEAQRFQPDLIILDVWLNQKLGTAAYHDLINAGFDSKVPVIFITALTADHPRSHAQRGQRYALYGKPFDMSKLLSDVEMLLGRTQGSAAENNEVEMLASV